MNQRQVVMYGPALESAGKEDEREAVFDVRFEAADREEARSGWVERFGLLAVLTLDEPLASVQPAKLRLAPPAPESALSVLVAEDVTRRPLVVEATVTGPSPAGPGPDQYPVGWLNLDLSSTGPIGRGWPVINSLGELVGLMAGSTRTVSPGEMITVGEMLRSWPYLTLDSAEIARQLVDHDQTLRDLRDHLEGRTGQSTVLALVGPPERGKTIIIREAQRIHPGPTVYAAGATLDEIRRGLAEVLKLPGNASVQQLTEGLRNQPRSTVYVHYLGEAADPGAVVHDLLVPLVAPRAEGAVTPVRLVVTGSPDTLQELVDAGADVLYHSPVRGEPAAADSGHPEPRLSRDYWTLNDRLSYQHHADAIAAFIRHRDTLSPLAIGIMGAWGAGKTSLMRMIQQRLDPGAPTGEPVRLSFDAGSRSRLRRWRRWSTGGTDRVSNGEVVRAAADTDLPPGDRERLQVTPEPASVSLVEWRPTVWFNPWMYQNGDQVWAGLAHSIINQLTERLPTGDRERFWLRLNLARVDRERVRRGWYRLALGRLLPLLVWWLVFLVLVAAGLLAGRWLPGVGGWLAPVGRYAGLSGTVLAAGWSVARWAQSRAGPASGPFVRLLEQPPMLPALRDDLSSAGPTLFDAVSPDPGYAARLGFLHLVHTDMRRVLNLVATPRRPVVVFVDDLDRCSPSTVAQLIEAVNLFLAGEFPNCLFVLAMEPGAVAAHVEAAYRDLATTLDGGKRAGMGWRFLEKIVQLPLSLPRREPDRELAGYLDHLLGGSAPEPSNATNPTPGSASASTAENRPSMAPAPGHRDRLAQPTTGGVPPGTAERLLAAIHAQRPTVQTLRAAAITAQRDVLGLDPPLVKATLAASELAFADLYSDNGARPALHAVLPALGPSNPRELKRYVNLFRFYTFVAERDRLRGEPAAGDQQIAKLAAFVVRWPHLVPALGGTHPSDQHRTHPLSLLENAARSKDDSWPTALADLDLDSPVLPPPAAEHLRDFLSGGPAIGPVACRLL